VLSEQDRTRWLWPLVEEAFQHLDRSVQGATMTRWHLQAGIAALHATGAPFHATPWDRIVVLYDDLLALQPTGVVRLNRAIALGMRDGADAGLAELRAVADDPRLASYHLLHAAHGYFLAVRGDTTSARTAYTRALACQVSAPERRFLLSRMKALD
jgi:RNA polymerase sigma-70 factor (ECF subfamily)